jgi:hypothetical protein
MKQMIAKALLLWLLSSGVALADGVMRLSGKLTGMTESHYLVETSRHIYYVQRKALAPADRKKVVAPGAQVAWMVPLTAIERVRPKR